MQKLYSCWQWLLYSIQSLNGKGHGIHSPFVYNFVQNILLDTRFFYAFEVLPQHTTNKYKYLLFRCLHFYKPQAIFFDNTFSIHDILFYIQAVDATTIIYVTSQHYQAVQAIKKDVNFVLITNVDAIESNKSLFFVLQQQSDWYALCTHLKISTTTYFFIWQTPPTAAYKNKPIVNSNIAYTYIHLYAIGFLCCRTEQMHNQHCSVFY